MSKYPKPKHFIQEFALDSKKEVCRKFKFSQEEFSSANMNDNGEYIILKKAGHHRDKDCNKPKRVKYKGKYYLVSDIKYLLVTGKWREEILEDCYNEKSKKLKISGNDEELTDKEIVIKFGGTPTKNSKPVDGYMPDGSPIEVKMHKTRPVGVEVLDKLHRYLEKTKKGYVIAYKFGKGFKKRIIELKKENGITTFPITIE